MKRLTTANDAFGQEILAHFLGHASCEVVERDDGLVDVTDGPATYFAPYAAWPPAEKEAIRLARGRVLDIGAGAGRVALHLQRTGLAVTSIDNSPLAVAVCRRRGARRVMLLPIEQISRFPSSSFDTIVMFGNNFGLMGSRARAHRLLRVMRRISTPEAAILAGTLDPRATRDPVHRAYHRRNLARGRMAGQVRIRIRFRRCIGPWFDYLFVSRKEMASIVRGSGWRIRRFIDGQGPGYVAVLDKKQ